MLTFEQPSAAWFEPFTGSIFGGIYPKHVFEAGADAERRLPQQPDRDRAVRGRVASRRTTRSSTRSTRTTASRTSPSSQRSTSRAAATPPRPPGPSSRPATGTMPGTCRSSRTSCNELWSKAAARARSSSSRGTSVERININFSDPNTEVDGQRSPLRHAPPDLHRPGGAPGAQPGGRRATRSPTSSTSARRRAADGQHPHRHRRLQLAQHDLGVQPGARPRSLLDEAGWVLDGDVRKKDGIDVQHHLRHHHQPGPPEDAGGGEAGVRGDRASRSR